jgi:hypothetical protein
MDETKKRRGIMKKTYKASIINILIMFVLGLLLHWLVIAQGYGSISRMLSFTGIYIFGLGFYFVSFYLIYFRVKSEGLYCDDEGIVVNFQGDKIFWHEVEIVEPTRLHALTATTIYLKDEFIETVNKRIRTRFKRKNFSISHEIIDRPAKFEKEIISKFNQYKEDNDLNNFSRRPKYTPVEWNKI